MTGRRRFQLLHRHAATDCATAFAAWKGYDSPLRHESVPASCLYGGHTLWWTVEADDAEAALGLLPPWVAARTEVTPVRLTDLP
ncbi:hypothetical protein [Pseudonocardia sp.]|uniref:hypothetical protein n=1 Tax=Pseudonocardia sp. TaxID=60912 RepID=UPI003D0B8FAC